MMEHEVYRIRSGLGKYSIWEESWGDYVRILIHGMTQCFSAFPFDDKVKLARTAPYVPKLTCPWEIVVTDETKHLIQSWHLNGVMFKLIDKKRIVYSDWHTWDLFNPPEAIVPKSGEPEDSILGKGKKHDPKLAKSLGNLWCVQSAWTTRAQEAIRFGILDIANQYLISKKFRDLIVEHDLDEYLEITKVNV